MNGDALFDNTERNPKDPNVTDGSRNLSNRPRVLSTKQIIATILDDSIIQIDITWELTATTVIESINHARENNHMLTWFA